MTDTEYDIASDKMEEILSTNSPAIIAFEKSDVFKKMVEDMENYEGKHDLFYGTYDEVYEKFYNHQAIFSKDPTKHKQALIDFNQGIKDVVEKIKGEFLETDLENLFDPLSRFIKQVNININKDYCAEKMDNAWNEIYKYAEKNIWIRVVNPSPQMSVREKKLCL